MKTSLIPANHLPQNKDTNVSFVEKARSTSPVFEFVPTRGRIRAPGEKGAMRDAITKKSLLQTHNLIHTPATKYRNRAKSTGTVFHCNNNQEAQDLTKMLKKGDCKWEVHGCKLPTLKETFRGTLSWDQAFLIGANKDYFAEQITERLKRCEENADQDLFPSVAHNMYTGNPLHWVANGRSADWCINFAMLAQYMPEKLCECDSEGLTAFQVVEKRFKEMDTSGDLFNLIADTKIFEKGYKPKNKADEALLNRNQANLKKINKKFGKKILKILLRV